MDILKARARFLTSPSTRRAWIEILRVTARRKLRKSPSPRRAWIEIFFWREVLEMPRVALHPEGVDRNEEYYKKAKAAGVALHPEGVDRNTRNIVDKLHAISRPPPGGRG